MVEGICSFYVYCGHVHQMLFCWLRSPAAVLVMCLQKYLFVFKVWFMIALGIWFGYLLAGLDDALFKNSLICFFFI